MSIELQVNGLPRRVESPPETPLLYVLRNDLGLKGTRFGCGLGQCGACTVIIDGEAVQSCDLPLSAAAGKHVTTIEALAGEHVTTIEALAESHDSATDPLAESHDRARDPLARRPRLHPLQEAFVAEQAAQCGYCASGIIMSAKALLDRNPRATDEDVREALAGKLCRCGTHTRILRAIRRAADAMSGGAQR